MNTDVLFEILLHLPVLSLFRFRAVCKYWRDVIDSQPFKKLHNTKECKDEEVMHLQYILRKKSISIKLLDIMRKPIKSHYFLRFDTKHEIVDGPVKGLICISPSEEGMQLIAIINPILRQSNILPVSPSCHSKDRSMCGIGFDEDYKVVHTVFCTTHDCTEAYLYSKRTNSWRDMSIDQRLFILSPIKSMCKNGSFAHWTAWVSWNLKERKKVILSFDMKNEVFRTITLPRGTNEILAKDGYSFVLFVSDIGRTKRRVYESSGEVGELVWNHVATLELETPVTRVLRSEDCVEFKNSDIVVLQMLYMRRGWFLYDYRARKLIANLTLPREVGSAIMEYEGSFVSP